MKNKIKKTIAASVVAAGAFTSGMNHEAIEDTFTGKKEYVVLNHGRFAVQAFNDADADVKETLNNTGGYIVKVTDKKAKEIEAKGFEVFENRTYSIKMAMFQNKGCRACWDSIPGKPGPVDPVDPIDPNPIDPPIDPPPPPTKPVTDEQPWGIQRVKGVEAQMKVDSSQAIVCIIDTGIDTDHPDLQGTFIGGRSFVRGNASFEDDQGHGTHVAGTVAALADGKGIVGVSRAKLYIVKALDRNGSGTGAAISEGIYQCSNVGAHIINMSLGSSYAGGPDPLIERAVKEVANAGVIVVMAAGNDGKRTGWPAAVEHPNCYAVASSDSNNRLSSFSSRGPEIDFIAPGSRVKSTKMGGGYITWDGTSMATPHVAAVFALAVASGKKTIKATNIGLPREHQGQGLVDALRTVSE